MSTAGNGNGGPAYNRRLSWNELMEAEDERIRIGRGEETEASSRSARAERSEDSAESDGWLQIPSAVKRGLELAGDSRRKIAHLWRERVSGDPGPETEARRFPRWRRSRNAPDYVGLALSGGGIRSATFSLGMLQKLDELELLRGFDYLATVSGGGYIGGFWSAWLTRMGGQDGAGPFPSTAPGRPEPRPVRHLREFSNFLRPRLDIFSLSTGRIVASLAGTILPSIVVALTLLSFGLGLWALLGFWLLAHRETTEAAPLLGAAILAFTTFAAQLIFELDWLGKPEEPAARGRGTYWIWTLSSALVAGATWWLLWHVVPLPYSFLFRPLGDGSTASAQVLLAFFPVLAWGVAITYLILVRVLSSRFVDDHRARARRSALGRSLSRLILCAAVWGVASLVWIAGQWLAAVGISGVSAAITTTLAGGGGFAWLRGLLSAQPNKPKGEGLAGKLKPLIPKVIAMVTLAAAAASIVSIVILVYQAKGHDGPILFFGAVTILFVLACFFFEPHENGFHAVYRERLTRAYLGASNEGPPLLPYASEVRQHDDLRMNELADRPLHLVCCAANDLAADPLVTLHRGADSAVVSKVGLQVGDDWRSWSGPGGEDPRVPYLSQVMTASAAAFNSHMGGISMRLGRSATFLLAALGLRLGLWLEGPIAPTERWLRRWAWLKRMLPGLLFFQELLGRSRSRASWIHLSDGAHFENLALYELVRRHCRYILVSDCGADPDVAFDDFGNAVRRVREDFGVEIGIDLSGLRRDNGGARQPVVAGDIRYPGGDKGILLYVKPTLIGDEPEDITQYARRNRDFPHETTLDQFYDEAQWEAYRRLGSHVIEKAIGGLSKRVAYPTAAKTRAKMVRVFLEARLAWPPSRSDDASVLTELDRDWTALERKVAEIPSPLRDELYPGLTPQTEGYSPPDLAQQLPYVQEALRLMAAVYLRSGMGDNPHAGSHPRYQGWLNRFGRWAQSTPFIAWWPWLCPIYDRSFVEFMGDEFPKLPVSKKHDRARVERVFRKSPLVPELDPWLLVERRPEPPYELYAYFGQIGPGGANLLAAVARLRVANGEAVLMPHDFKVPPGLWSIGIGETFLDRLVEIFELRPDVYELRVEPKPGSSKSFSTAISTLLVGAGFERDSKEGGGFRRSVAEP